MWIVLWVLAASLCRNGNRGDKTFAIAALIQSNRHDVGSVETATAMVPTSKWRRHGSECPCPDHCFFHLCSITTSSNSGATGEQASDEMPGTREVRESERGNAGTVPHGYPDGTTGEPVNSCL